jgi:hypothetical protein
MSTSRPADTYSIYARRVLTWLLTRPDQPCPWGGLRRRGGAVEPCGHLVGPGGLTSGSFSGCPICQRRISPNHTFLTVPPRSDRSDHVQHHTGDLRLLHLAFDLVGAARARFELVIGRPTPLSREDRVELETVIDAMGPKAAAWLPERIPVQETMALAIGRLWMVSPDRAAIARATAGHLRTATDVLRVAAVLTQADPALAEPLRFRSMGRGLRRVVLEALERLPPAELVDDMLRRPGLWKRAGERLHPFELADRLPTVALAFAALRETDLAAASFGAAVRARAADVPNVRIADNRVRVVPWASDVETALRAGDVRAATARLAERPEELLHRVDQIVRVASARQLDAIGDVLTTIRRTLPRGEPATLLTLASHLARRSMAWPRRVFFPRGDVLHAWAMPDGRPALRPELVGPIVAGARAALVERAEARPKYARAVLDRGLSDLVLPLREPPPRGKLVWPRGSAAALPAGDALRLFLHWEEPPGARVDLDLSLALFDADWRHLGTCDHESSTIASGNSPAAMHGGDVTAAPGPHGATETVDLYLSALAASGARHAIMVVFSQPSVSFDRLPLSFVGVVSAQEGGTPFAPRAAARRFDLRGRSAITVPLAIDLEARRLRWLDVHIRGRGALHHLGGYRAALAHLGRDFAHLIGTGARPTLWDVACIHATARANVVYVRGPAGITLYRRRDGEPTAGRLARLLTDEPDDTVTAIPTANAPTWVALLRDDLPLPGGSAGYILDARRTGGESLARLAAIDLIAELAPR